MEQAIQHGADIIIRDWVRLRAGERILIVSSQKYAVEVAAMQQAAQAVGSVADVLMLDDLHEQVGQYFDDREDAFDPYNAVIGAAEYSLITTRAVKRVIARRNRFLSLPLSTSNGQSLLSYDFLNMSLPKSRIMASIIMACYQNASHIHVTTELGTNLDFNIEGRVPGFFNGCCHDGKGLSSASVEVYVAPVESDTNGTLILDGSMGYIGIVDSPVRVELRGGRIVEIEDNASGRRLKQFLARFHDPENMVVAAEFGIGLNTHSRCAGNCYIEDESTYGTFHIGFGRNIALGYFDTLRLFGRCGGTAYAMLPDNEEFLARFAEQYQKLLAEVCARAPEIDLVEKNARLRANYPAPYAPNPSAPTRGALAPLELAAERVGVPEDVPYTPKLLAATFMGSFDKDPADRFPALLDGRDNTLVTERAIAAAVPEEFVTALVSKTLGELPIL